MNKKIQTLAVVASTIVCVFIMLYSDKVYMYKNVIINTVEKREHKEKVSRKDVGGLRKSVQVEDSGKFEPISDEYKKIKMNSLAQQIENDKADFFGEEDKKITTKGNSNNMRNKSDTNRSYSEDINGTEEDISVFKTESPKVTKDLTSSDKTKLLSAAGELSAIDYEKVKGYLASGKNSDTKSALRLLRERLSDKDYEKIKGVADKFIGTNVFEQ